MGPGGFGDGYYDHGPNGGGGGPGPYGPYGGKFSTCPKKNMVHANCYCLQ